jgi:transcriptional regulator
VRTNPDYALDDPAAIREVIRAYPFITLITAAGAGLIASHCPVLIDDDRPGLSLVGHLGRPDDERHELGRHEVLVIAQGPHGYISPSWYGDRGSPAVPTWDFVAVHLHGRPELLDPAQNRHWLGRLVDHFEAAVVEPRSIDTGPDAGYADRIASGTVGFRLGATRVEAKAKLSQDKPAAVVAGVLAGLDTDGPYRNPALAAAVRAARG